MTATALAVDLALHPYELIRAGLHVFPVDVEKHPLTPHGLNDATLDAEQVSLWQTDYGARIWGWGVNAGASGLVVADIDVKDGKDGHAALAGASLTLPVTHTYRTPSGGEHHVYAHPDAVAVKSTQDHDPGTGKLDGVDCRAGGGYVVWYGPTPESSDVFAAPPAWLVTPRSVPSGPRGSADVEAWRAANAARPATPLHGLETTVRDLEDRDFGHADMIQAQAKIVRTGALGNGQNVTAYLDRLEAAWLREPWNTPEHARDWQTSLAGAVAQFGHPDPDALTAAAPSTSAPDSTPAPVTPVTPDEPAPPDVSIYVDAAAILSGTYEPPTPTRGGKRADGLHLLYPAAVNGLVGDPETGKTLIATACAADELFQGGSVLWIDLDHNGAAATLLRFRRYGVAADTLTDRGRFRLATPEDVDALLAVIGDASTWRPSVAVLDSVGEMLPLFGASSNNADEYTAVNQRTLVKLARQGAAVLGIDHMAKGVDSRTFGAGGTVAKKRAIDGAYLRVTTESGFTKGVGGRAELAIIKDRHGALRQAASTGREPRVAVFRLEDRGDTTHWHFDVPGIAEAVQADTAVDELLALDPPPRSVRDVADRMGWGFHRASAALRQYRERVAVAGVAATLPGNGGHVVALLLSPEGEQQQQPPATGSEGESGE